jgi:hypothetical protein
MQDVSIRGMPQDSEPTRMRSGPILVFWIPAAPDGTSFPLREGALVSYPWPFSHFEERRCEEDWQGTHHQSGARFDFPSRFTFYHRPPSSYWKAFSQAGFACLEFEEPVLQPPYPPEFTPEEVKRTTQCAWSVAFQLRAT